MLMVPIHQRVLILVLYASPTVLLCWQPRWKAAAAGAASYDVVGPVLAGEGYNATSWYNERQGWYVYPCADRFISLDTQHVFGPWCGPPDGLYNAVLSSDAGLTWQSVRSAHILQASKVVAVPAGSRHYADSVFDIGFGSELVRLNATHHINFGSLDQSVPAMQGPAVGGPAVAHCCPYGNCAKGSGVVSPSVTYYSAGASGVRIETACQHASFTGLPLPLTTQLGLTSGFTGPSTLQLADGSFLATFALKFATEPARNGSWQLGSLFGQKPGSWHGLPKKIPMSIVAFRSTDGLNWKFLSTVANHSAMPWSYYGPQEHGIAYDSADNNKLLCVMRVDTDGGCPGGPAYKNFAIVSSTDHGRSFTNPKVVDWGGCVRPRMLRLSDGPLLLFGGRWCSACTDGSCADPAKGPTHTLGQACPHLLWVRNSSEPDPTSRLGWEMICVSDLHNARSKMTIPKYQLDVYGSLIELGPTSAGVVYPRNLGNGPQQVFMMQFHFNRTTAALATGSPGK